MLYKILIIMIMTFAMNVHAAVITFTTQISESQGGLPLPADVEGHEVVLQIIEKPIYSTTKNDIDALIKSQNIFTPIEINVKEKDDRYSVLGIVQRPASIELDNSLACFFLFRDNQLVATSFTLISLRAHQTMRFVTMYGEEWTDWDIKYREVPKTKKYATWNSWLTSICEQLGRINKLKQKKILQLFRIKNAEIEISRAPSGYTVYTCINVEDETSPKTYFFQTYPYVRRGLLVFRKGSLISVSNCLEIAASVLPEDGSTDPLNMESYILIAGDSTPSSR